MMLGFWPHAPPLLGAGAVLLSADAVAAVQREEPFVSPSVAALMAVIAAEAVSTSKNKGVDLRFYKRKNGRTESSVAETRITDAE